MSPLPTETPFEPQAAAPSPADAASLASDLAAQATEAASGLAGPHTRLEIFHGYLGVFVIAFVVTLLATPIMRRMAVRNNVVDRPSGRKIHRLPVAYLGGVAVFLGLMAGIFFSYIAPYFGMSGSSFFRYHATGFLHPESELPHPVPISVLLGMTIIMLLGLIDDVVGTLPRLKIAGMFVAAAALAIDDVGVRVAQGVLEPTLGAWLNNPELVWRIDLPFPIPGVGASSIPIDLIYWTGTAIIAMAVLGACNASNLIDGLDGLCTGVTAIAAGGLLIVAITLASQDYGPRDAQRIILCMAVLGACLGFLPHNFNPATIFLGDAGSLLLGYMSIVIILTLGDKGETPLVLAGLVMYAIPIIDTVLAIVRRKLAGKSISDADDQHLHHMLKRGLGVKGAAFALYGIGIGFAALGILMSLWQARVIYALALVAAAYIVVIAIKMARRRAWELQNDSAPAPVSPPAPGVSIAKEPVPAAPSRI